MKEYGAGSYTDIGAINSPITMTFNFDENEVITANAGTLLKQVKNPTVDGGFTMINLNNTDIVRLSGGMFSETTVAGGSVSSIDNQVIASDAASDLTPYNLSLVETGASALKVSSALVIASVTGSVDGALTVNDDYTIIDDSNSPSLKSIVLNIAGTLLTTMTQTFTIVYTSVTPIASSTIYAGTTTTTLNAAAIKVTHTNSASVIDREFEIFSADPTSGGFQFNFKGANEDGTEEMPLTFKGKIDTSLTDGEQLFRYYTVA